MNIDEFEKNVSDKNKIIEELKKENFKSNGWIVTQTRDSEIFNLLKYPRR